MNTDVPGIRRFVTTLSLALVIAACAGGRGSSSSPVPAPRDVASAAELSPELARLRIAWRSGQERSSTLIYLDGSDPLPILLPEYAVTAGVSASGRYVVYATSVLPEGDIEMLDLQTQDRHILVRGRERFPGASLLYPSFAPDEEHVVFEVGSSNRIDLAIVDVGSGEVQFLDVQGGFNKWPQLSPDGAWILVACEDPTQGGFSLCLLDRSHRVRRHLVDDLVASGGEFTPDGQSVVYVAVVGGVFGEGQLYRVDLDGRGRRLLVSGLHPGADVLALTSNDVVFTCSDAEQPACRWVCVVNIDGTDVRRLTYLGEQCVDVNAP